MFKKLEKQAPQEPCMLSMSGKINFVVTINYDIIGIQATTSLEKRGRTIF